MATVGLFPSMNPLMLTERGGSAEGLPTRIASEGLHSTVSPVMRHQGGVIVEGFPAHLTFIGPLSCVTPPVDSEMGPAGEGPAAFLTRVGLLTSVAVENKACQHPRVGTVTSVQELRTTRKPWAEHLEAVGHHPETVRTSPLTEAGKHRHTPGS